MKTIKLFSLLAFVTMMALSLAACGDDNDEPKYVEPSNPYTIKTLQPADTDQRLEFYFNPNTGNCEITIYNVVFTIDDRQSPKLTVCIETPYTVDDGHYVIDHPETIIPSMIMGSTKVPADQFPVTKLKADLNRSTKDYMIYFECHDGVYSNSGKLQL